MRAGRLLAILAISLGMGVPTAASAEQALYLELLSDATSLRVVLRNTSALHVKAVCRFAIGSEADPVEITLRILDQNRKLHAYQLKSHGSLPRAADWCDLPPNQLVGVYIPISEVRYAYELPSGIYTVQATYSWRDQAGKELDVIQSNAVQIHI
jgi:hypothetical protein